MTQNKIKIVHVVEGFIGGLATYLSHVLPELVHKGYDVTLICSLDRQERGMADKMLKLLSANVKIKYVPMQRGLSLWRDLYCVAFLYGIFKKERFDIIHTHCSKAGAIGRIAAFCATIPIRLHSSHCFAYLRHREPMSTIYYVAEKLFGMLTSKYIAVSSFEYTNAQNSGLFSRDKCLLVENGIPQNKRYVSKDRSKIIRSKWQVAENAFIITTGCRYVHYKGLKLLIEAAKHVESDCCIIIAGEGQQKEELERCVNSNVIKNRIMVLTPTRTMEEILSVSDIAILCSEIEAQPYFLLEAMWSRCPIIASDVPGNRELIGDQRGMLVSRVPQELARAIDKMCMDKEARDQYAEAAYRYVAQKHTLNRQVEQLSQIYRTMYEEGDIELSSRRNAARASFLQEKI